MARLTALALLLVAHALAAPAPEFRAGVAVVRITPDLPAWLTGFAARTRPAERITQDLYAKALALDDGQGGRVVIVTADLLGVTKEITDEVSARLAHLGLRRAQLLFNASHTHSGPSVWPRLHLAPDQSDAATQQVETYGRQLIDKLTQVASQALTSLVPARLAFTRATAGFAINRRTEHLAAIRPGEQFPAPVDHEVPVWLVTAPDNTPRAVLFGYACHNTVLTGDTNEVNGDYAGYAQRALERDLPGAIALFLALCAGDQRASPRGTRVLAEQHGEALAAAVRAAVAARPTPLASVLGAAYEEIRLPFQIHTRESYAAEAKSADVFAARRGRLMLLALEAGRPVRDTPYPVQALRLGDGPLLLALGGEVVVDYALTLKREYGDGKLVVAAYSNDVMGYIPSLRLQREGGYEAGDAMMYYAQPGWFTEQVEPLVLAASRRVLAMVWRAAGPNRPRAPSPR